MAISSVFSYFVSKNSSEIALFEFSIACSNALLIFYLFFLGRTALKRENTKQLGRFSSLTANCFCIQTFSAFLESISVGYPLDYPSPLRYDFTTRTKKRKKGKKGIFHGRGFELTAKGSSVEKCVHEADSDLQPKILVCGSAGAKNKGQRSQCEVVQLHRHRPEGDRS